SHPSFKAYWWFVHALDESCGQINAVLPAVSTYYGRYVICFSVSVALYLLNWVILPLFLFAAISLENFRPGFTATNELLICSASRSNNVLISEKKRNSSSFSRTNRYAFFQLYLYLHFLWDVFSSLASPAELAVRATMFMQNI